MPRGVYERKSAQSAGVLTSAKPKAKAKPAASKPKQKAVKSASVKPVVQLVSPAFLVEPNFFKSRRVAVDAIEGEELKAYARSIGITQRDVDGLSQDRLRQNCKARIAQVADED